MTDTFIESGREKDNDIRGKRAAAYVRVSTQEQEKQKTSRFQLERIVEAAKRWECPLEEPYIDEGYSGELMERPALDRLLTEIKEKGIEVVFVTEPDRLARDYMVGELLREEIQKRGATLFFLSLPPARSPDEEFSQRVVAASGDLDRKKIKFRTRLGKLGKAKSGFIVGGKSPYGYRYVPRTRGTQGYYEIIEEEKEWVEKIYRWFVEERLSIEKIALRLTEMKVPTQSGGTVWRKSTVHRILGNQTYAGLAHYNKLKAVEPKGPGRTGHYRRLKNTSREVRPKEEWIPIRVPRIIDEKTWQRAQARFQENARLSPRNTRHLYLLRGKVFCGICGLLCYAGICRLYPFYQCSNRHRLSPLPKTCPARSVNAHLLDSLVWETISKALSHPDIIIGQLRKVAETQGATLTQKEKELETVKRRLEQLDKAQAKLTHLYLFHKEVMSEKEYLNRVGEIEERGHTLQEQRKQLEAECEKRVDLETLREDIDRVYYEAVTKLETLTFEKKRRLVELLVDKVMINGDRLMIEGVIPRVTSPPSDPGKAVSIGSTSSPCEIQNGTNWYKLVRKDELMKNRPNAYFVR